MTKGSGMIQPQMATTLGFVLTDAEIPAAALRAMLKRGVERSYNRLSVDGDTSTNDTLVLLANGASGVRPDPKELANVEEAIARRDGDLAQAIARDGEGARKFVTIVVTGAAIERCALRGSPAPSPIRRWSRPQSRARTRTGAGYSPPPEMPAWHSTRRRPIFTCRA